MSNPKIIQIDSLAEVDRQTQSLVGLPAARAFELLDQGKYNGTIVEAELKILRYLAMHGSLMTL